MITVTGRNQLEAWRAGILPRVEQVRPDVWSIPVPFPGSPMRYTLSYLLVGDGGAVVIDPGWNSQTGWQHLTAGLGAAGVGLADITGIVVTHFHPDHLGMAGTLAKESGAWVALGEDETIPVMSPASATTKVAEDRSNLLAWGVPEARLEEFFFGTDAAKMFGELTDADLLLTHGQLIPVTGLNLEVVATPGHSKGHICLLDHTNELIFSGDHVLPRISPHISFEAHGLPNPLATYLDSLGTIALSGSYEVLPAHEYRFKGIAERAAELSDHHRERGDQILSVLQTDSHHTVWDVARRLHWSRGWESLQGMNLRFALAETASHLVFLRAAGCDIDIPGLASEAQPVPE